MHNLEYSNLTGGKNRSACVGKVQDKCRPPRCKYAKGSKRQYCRSSGKNCRGKIQKTCSRRNTCKYAKGSKRQFCRTKKNKRRDGSSNARSKASTFSTIVSNPLSILN